MAKRSVQDVQQTLNEVKAILHNLILTKGWDYVTFATLSKATGLSRAGILYHFSSKKEIYNWVRHDLHKQLELEVNSVEVSKTNPHLINFFLRGCLDYGCVVLFSHFNSIEVGQMVFRSIEKHPSNN